MRLEDSRVCQRTPCTSHPDIHSESCPDTSSSFRDSFSPSSTLSCVSKLHTRCACVCVQRGFCVLCGIFRMRNVTKKTPRGATEM